MKNLTAISKELLADLETPVSVFAKLCRKEKDAIVLESNEQSRDIGRYSVVAYDPIAFLELDENGAWRNMAGKHMRFSSDTFFEIAQKTLDKCHCKNLPNLPCVGSWVGYIGYEAVQFIEKLPKAKKHNLPMARLIYPSRFVVFDHLKGKMTLLAIDRNENQAQQKLKKIENGLTGSIKLELEPEQAQELTIEKPDQNTFMEAVKKAKEQIMAGEIFQVVLSAPFVVKTKVDPLAVFRQLRVINPSPYMFFIQMPGFTLAGASPETLVKTDGQKVFLRPIAGTRKRDQDPIKDQALEQELLASEKERAEHLMLVDLARNDAFKVAQTGKITVSPFMTVERFSHVMHLVTKVYGDLAPHIKVFEVFKACFPAGTVSGAPKVRAMEIINQSENKARGPYAGAVGFFGPGLKMDTCIAIRMIQFGANQAICQAGAGIVADSDPDMEYQEINHKAAMSLVALKTAAKEA